MGADHRPRLRASGAERPMIARTRRRLLRAARAFAKDGDVPPGVDDPDIYAQCAAAISSPTRRSPGAMPTTGRCAPRSARCSRLRSEVPKRQPIFESILRG